MNMLRPLLLFLFFSAIALSFAFGATARAESPREPAGKPNIIFIYADDLGYGDVSCYGATMIDTPNIDKLATQGMKFTDAHAAASLCSPSRYGLLTGHSPWRLHKKGNGYRIPPDRLTLGSFLQTQGYQTAAIGKWHLGYSKDWNKLPITGPMERGFDYHFGVPSNHNDPTRAFIENHDLVGREPGKPFEIVKGQDFPDGLAEPRVEDQVDTVLTSKVVDFIEENVDQPFFVYFAPCSPHTHITPTESFRGTSKAGTFGDYVQELDSHVGTIMQKLEQLKIADNTLLIFASDNGGSPKDFKGTQNCNLNLASDAGDIRRKFKTARIDARKLGHYVNGPWRDGKGHPYEGGHRVPFIARWPGKIEAGSTSDNLFNLTDMLATFADIHEVDLPADAGEDSISLLPVLLGKTSETPTPTREVIFVQGDGKDDAIAVRVGKWKLIDRRRSGIQELYDLSVDQGEANDLAADHADIVQRLSEALANAESAGHTKSKNSFIAKP